MSYIHILRSRNEPYPWWPADQRWDCAPDKVVIPDCCLCKMPASKVDVRLWIVDLPKGDPGNYQYEKTYEGEPEGFDFPYDEPRWETRCADGCGCNEKSRRRSSRHLREWMYE